VTLLQAFILGAVQGLAEFLPVSSSGHLILVPAIFGWEPHPVAFDAVIHLGTLLAVVYALREDVTRIVVGIFRGDSLGRVGWLIAVGTIPTLLVGFLLSEVSGPDLRSPSLVAAMLAGWGALLWIADRSVKPDATDDIRRLSWKQAILVAVVQVFSLIPGTSRSGATITAGLFAGIDRATAARFSFLLGLPAIAAAVCLSFVRIWNGAAPVAIAPTIVGIGSSFAFGVLAIRLLLKLMKSASYAPFAVYRIALAAVVWLVLVR